MKNFRHQHRPKKSSLIVGKKAVLEAMEAGKPLDRIYLNQNLPEESTRQLRNLAHTNNIPVNFVPVEKLNSFNVGNHEGCVAQMSKVQYHELQQVISWVVEKGETPLFLI